MRPQILAVSPASPATLYAALPARGVWKSADGGGTWTRLPGLESFDVLRLAPDPRDPDRVYAGTATSVLVHEP